MWIPGLKGLLQLNLSTMAPWGQKKVVIVERLLLWGGRGVI